MRLGYRRQGASPGHQVQHRDPDLMAPTPHQEWGRALVTCISRSVDPSHTECVIDISPEIIRGLEADAETNETRG